ncbi:MAG: DUF1659 domain-containing protein [bacterium]
MAVVATPLPSRVSITFIEENGVKRTRSYGPIKPTATDQDVYDFAVALAALQEYQVDSITRTDQKELMGA